MGERKISAFGFDFQRTGNLLVKLLIFSNKDDASLRPELNLLGTNKLWNINGGSPFFFKPNKLPIRSTNIHRFAFIVNPSKMIIPYI